MEDVHREEPGPLKLDRLGSARSLLLTLVGITAAGLVLLLAWTSRSLEIETCRDWVSELRLSYPAWAPSGRPGRQPAPLYPNVDTRPSALFPRFDPGPENLLMLPQRPLERHLGAAPSSASRRKR
jgi:hypothetical protein